MDYEIRDLIPLVAELASRYTRGESSSVTYEKAEQFMDAVIYTIEEFSRTASDKPVPAGIPARQAFEAGHRLICEKTRSCQRAYNLLMSGFDAYGNEFYYDTVVKGLPKFFMYYDPEFNPQDHILTLDYLTRDFDVSLRGIDQIGDYLRSIIVEQQYLGGFPRSEVIQALSSWNRNYRELPLNVADVMEQYESARAQRANDRKGDGQQWK